MKDLAQDVAEGVLGAAKDGSVKVFIVKVLIFSIAICQLKTHAQHTHAAPHAPLGRHITDRHVKDAAQDVAEDVTQDVVEGLLGAAEDGSVKVLILPVGKHEPLMTMVG